MTRWIFYPAMVFLSLWTLPYSCVGQSDGPGRDSIPVGLQEEQQKALAILERTDTLSGSPVWPNIKPALFFANIRKNILYPSRINQGKSTNFCSYAALTHVLVKYQPVIYLTSILSLYRTGKTTIHKKKLEPSKRVREAAGTLQYQGELDILHADQLWFLTLADQFRGYLNLFNWKYDQGDENSIWASTNYGKFNSMLKRMGDFKIKAAGSDVLRPRKTDIYEYISGQLRKGVVLLYINNKYTHPVRYTPFTLQAPTHFVVLYDLYEEDDMIEIKYWDYGLKTEQLMTEERLRKLVFGVTTIEKK
jgi:hypothetical protein